MAPHEQDQSRPATTSPLPMASSSGVWEPVNGSIPGGPAGPGDELVTVKDPAQAGGLVMNW